MFRASLEASLPREPFTPRERASKRLFQKDNSLLDTHSTSVSPSAAMPLIVCLYRCAARHGAGPRSITFCSASATTWPTSRPGSRPISWARSWPPSTASAVEKKKIVHFSACCFAPCRRYRLRRSQMGSFKCRATTERALRPAHTSRPPSRAAFPPAPTSCLTFFWFPIPLRGFLRQAHCASPLRRNRHS